MTHGSAQDTTAPRMHLVTLLTLSIIIVLGNAYVPVFESAIANITVAVGRDATFRCHVRSLGGYRVGWVKADTKAIQAIHDHVITHNPRVSVSHVDHVTWNLHLKRVQVEDAGAYMCQINTDPMKSQVGMLDVVVPPDFIDEQTSGDTVTKEGGAVALHCRARGYPEPNIQWRREDGGDIVMRDSTGKRTRGPIFHGERLVLTKISRAEMGVYMCIATNGVPPTISKRIVLHVNFHPVLQAPNQLVGAPLGTDVTLECYVQASPKSVNFWKKANAITGINGEMVISSDKYDIQSTSISLYESRMTLTVRNFEPDDVGTYKCLAKGSLGDVESSIRLYDIPGPRIFGHPQDEEDYNDQFGSAERDQDEEFPNNVVERRRPVSHTRPTAKSPRGRFADRRGNHVPVDPAPSSSSALVPVRVLSSLLLLLLLQLLRI